MVVFCHICFEIPKYQGSTFTCVIPLKVSLIEDDSGLVEDFEDSLALPSSQIMTPSIKATTKAPDTKSLNHQVLVVEDNAIAQTVAKSILTQSGCHVDVAASGQEALNLWKQNEYDSDLYGYWTSRHGWLSSDSPHSSTGSC